MLQHFKIQFLKNSMKTQQLLETVSVNKSTQELISFIWKWSIKTKIMRSKINPTSVLRLTRPITCMFPITFLNLWRTLTLFDSLWKLIFIKKFKFRIDWNGKWTSRLFECFLTQLRVILQRNLDLLKVKLKHRWKRKLSRIMKTRWKISLTMLRLRGNWRTLIALFRLINLIPSQSTDQWALALSSVVHQTQLDTRCQLTFEHLTLLTSFLSLGWKFIYLKKTRSDSILQSIKVLFQNSNQLSLLLPIWLNSKVLF